MAAISRPTRGSSTETNNARMRENGLFIGIVKKNDDPQKMGRLAVWIPEMGGKPDVAASWITVSYASPFAGASNADSTQQGSKAMAGSQTSYGMWMTPPDINNEVLVMFADGDVGRGYWFACTWQQNMNHMVPGVACNTSTDPTLKSKGTVVPTVEYNKQGVQNPNNPPRPTFTPLTDGLTAQGLVSDPERGPGSTSARRESPSKAFGFTTPRGNSLNIDDNEANEMVRIRTRGGTQIVVHETGGYVYIVTKGGNSWLEISDAGIDIYTNKSISARAELDFNIRADRNILLDAGKSICLRSGEQATIMAEKAINIGSNMGELILSSEQNAVTLNGSTAVELKTDGIIRTSSVGNTTMKTGGEFLRTASSFSDNGNHAAQDAVADLAKGPVPKPQPETISGDSYTLDTIVSRMPAHEPWSGHPKSNLPPPSAPQDMDAIANRAGSGSTESSHGVSPSVSVQTGEGTRSMNLEDGTQCGLGVGTKKASNEVFNAVKTASTTSDVPFGHLMAIADVGSSFDPNGNAGTSAAKGLFPFSDGSWSTMVSHYGNENNVSTDPNEVYNPTSNAKMAAAHYKENSSLLQANGIAQPSCGQVYMTNMLGGGQGSKFIGAYQNNPNTPLTDVLTPTEIASNPTWFSGKTTVGEAYQGIDGAMNAKADAYTAQQSQQGPCVRGSYGSTPLPADTQSLINKYRGSSVGSGQCVALVQQGSGLPVTARWKQGDDISAANADSIPPGTPIATFQNGAYTNSTNGNSHAAYYLGTGTTPDGQPGIRVFDQWSGQAAHERVIPFNSGKAPCNNGSSYSIINT